MTTTHTQPAGCDLDSLRDLIANDGFAMSFQSMGQYRAALIAAARAAQTPQIAQHAETIEQYVPPQAEILADEAKLYRDLTGDAMALGFDGVPAALEALRTVRSQAPQGDTRQGAHTCTPADERALKALTAITERVALTYRICCGTAPKQSVGELLDVTIQMPEWEIVRATLQARAAQGAGTAPALIPIPQVRPVSPENSSWEDVDQVTFDRLKANGTYETRTLYAAHPAPISTAPVGATDPVQIVREAVRQLAESPRRKDSSYVEGMVVGANMCLVRLERVLGRAATHPAPESTAAATTASASDEGDGLLDMIYPPKALLKREDWDPATRKPKVRELAPSRAADGQQGASRAALSGEEMFNIAAPYFAWNADSWHKATQATITMQGLLNYTRAVTDAALARAPLPAQEFDHAEFMRLVREFAEVVYGVCRTTEDVGANLVNYVKSLASPAQAVEDARNAARYRWLMQQVPSNIADIFEGGTISDVDQLIDEEIAAQADRAAQSRAQSDTTGDRNAS